MYPCVLVIKNLTSLRRWVYLLRNHISIMVYCARYVFLQKLCQQYCIKKWLRSNHKKYSCWLHIYIYIYIYIYINVFLQINLCWTRLPSQPIHHIIGQPTVRNVILFGVVDIFAILHESLFNLWNNGAPW